MSSGYTEVLRALEHCEPSLQLEICFKIKDWLTVLVELESKPCMWARPRLYGFKNYTRENEVGLWFPAKTTKFTKLLRATNKKERNNAKIFICPWIMIECKGRSRKKRNPPFPTFFFLPWQTEWASAAPFKSDYLTFRNEFAKETAAYHEAANRMHPSPPAPSPSDEQLEACRTKWTFVLHRRRRGSLSFHSAGSPLLPFSHIACPKVNDVIWKLCQSHSYYSTKDMWGSL